METRTIHKKKIFFSWQDEKREAWLIKMSQQGLHLKEPRSFCDFLFEKGPARQFVYRLDFNQDKLAQDYLELIKDSGWEYLGTQSGWHYWRRRSSGSKVPELFTDSQSKLQKYQRLFMAYTASTPAIAAVLIIFEAVFKRFPNRHPLWFVILFISTCMLAILFSVINAIMIYQRMGALKREKVL